MTMSYFTFRKHLNEMIANNNSTDEELCERIHDYTLNVIGGMDDIKAEKCFVNLATKKMRTIKGKHSNETIDGFIASLELYLTADSLL